MVFSFQIMDRLSIFRFDRALGAVQFLRELDQGEQLGP